MEHARTRDVQLRCSRRNHQVNSSGPADAVERGYPDGRDDVMETAPRTSSSDPRTHRAHARLVFDCRAQALLRTERGLELNAVAHAILSLCDGRNTVDEIIAKLTERFSRTEPETVRRDVGAFLLQLSQRGVLLADE